ncbi:aldo/keto reductase [Nocardiopsis rhodophaea]|uniref:Aldo/keto reductase n=1 Tax=Nocardiopsis rhodophaea TaxID=280238 RepID=A0ABN2S6R6_9ACTN
MDASTTVALNDGVETPRLGLGVFQVGPDEAAAAVRTALQAGYRMVDTASVYGNEKGVGRGIAESGVAREDVVVVTKVWNDDQGYDATLRAFDASAAALGLDYVDQYLIHWPRPRLGLYPQTWRALCRLRDEGRVRSIGVSNFEPEHIERLIAETGVAPAVNQVELHPGLHQGRIRAFHADHGIVTQAWSPLGRGQGFLSHRAVAAVAEAHGRTPAQVVLRWHLQLGVVPLPKSVTPERIRGNLDVFGFELDAAEMDLLTDIGDGYRVGPDPSLLFDVS